MPGRRSDFAAVAFSFKGVYDYMGRRLKTPYRQNTAVIFLLFCISFPEGRLAGSKKAARFRK